MNKYTNKEFTTEEAYFFYKMACALQGSIFGSIVSAYFRLPDEEFEKGVTEQVVILQEAFYTHITKDFAPEAIEEAVNHLADHMDKLMEMKFRMKAEMLQRVANVGNDLKEAANVGTAIGKKLGKEALESDPCPICAHIHTEGQPCPVKPE